MNLIGVDIGGTKCALSVPDGAEEVREVGRFPTTDVQGTLDRIFSEISSLAPGSAPVFGVSCGGPLDAKRGLILSPPNLPGWDRIAICDELTKRFGGRAFLMNDANACALAEWQFGAGRGCQSMIFLTMGTGMGAGLILDGRLYEGVSGNAGEVGHMRLAPEGPVGFGKAGSFEGFCSGGGIAQLARKRVTEFTGASGLKQLAPVKLENQTYIVKATAGDVAKCIPAIRREPRQHLGWPVVGPTAGLLSRRRLPRRCEGAGRSEGHLGRERVGRRTPQGAVGRGRQLLRRLEQPSILCWVRVSED
jgi:glucokinase